MFWMEYFANFSKFKYSEKVTKISPSSTYNLTLLSNVKKSGRLAKFGGPSQKILNLPSQVRYNIMLCGNPDFKVRVF